MTSIGAADKRALKFRFLFFEQLPHLEFCLFIENVLYRMFNLEARRGKCALMTLAVSFLYQLKTSCLNLRLSMTWKVIKFRLFDTTANEYLSLIILIPYLFPRKQIVFALRCSSA